MSDIREAFKIGLFAGFIVALPIAVFWGMLILMTWLQKAVGL